MKNVQILSKSTTCK